MLRLNGIFTTYIKTRFDLQKSEKSTIELEPGKYKFALINSYQIEDREYYLKVVNTLLKNQFFVLFVTTKLPVNPIIHNSLVYIEVKGKHMGMVTFKREDYSKFNFIVGLGAGGKEECKRVNFRYNTPIVENLNRLNYNKETIVEQKTQLKILFDTNYQATHRGLGDILMTTAIIKQIKKDFPNSHLTYSTKPTGKDILENNPYIDDIKSDIFDKFQFEKELDNYDKHFFLEKKTEDYTEERNQQPRIDSMAELFGMKLESKLSEIYLTNEEKFAGKKYINKDKINIVFCIEAIEKYRNWTSKQLNELIGKFDKNIYNLIVVGNKDIIVPTHVNNLIKKTTIRELLSIIFNCDLVITVDNFVSHIAAVFEKPEVILYTTIPSKWRCSYYKNAKPIQSQIKCSPCNNLYKVSEDKRRRSCPNNGKCIEAITPELVFDKVKEFKIAKQQSIEDLFPKVDLTKIKTHSLEKLNDSKIIFISLWRRMGDCLFGIPTIKAIRKKYPKHKIIWGTHYKYYDIVKNLPYIDSYVLFQGKVDEGWDAYLPSADGQIQEYLKVLEPGRIFNLHISPRYSADLTKQDYTIVEYVAYKLAGLDKIDTTLEYFPNKKIESKVKKDFETFKKGYKGIIIYNGRCFSIEGKGIYKESELDYTLSLFERGGYKVINIGNILEGIDISRDNYHFCSLDYMYYAIKCSDMFIGYDSGLRNLALTVKNSKILSLENEQSLLNKTKIEMLSKNKNHVGIDINVDKPLDIFLKGMSLINNEEIAIQEYRDILKFQFVRRKESLVKVRQDQKEERGILNG